MARDDGEVRLRRTGARRRGWWGGGRLAFGRGGLLAGSGCDCEMTYFNGFGRNNQRWTINQNKIDGLDCFDNSLSSGLLGLFS